MKYYNSVMLVLGNFSNAPGISESGFTLSNIIILSKKKGQGTKSTKALIFSAKALNFSAFSA